MPDPVLLTDDLTRQVYLVPERLTKRCAHCGGSGTVSDGLGGGPHRTCNSKPCLGSGRVPIGIGDTLELRCETCDGDCYVDAVTEREIIHPDATGAAGEPLAECHACGSLGERSASVVWEGPAARVRAWPEPDWTAIVFVPEDGSGVVWIARDLYDALNIGSDPDAWVYLVGEAS